MVKQILIDPVQWALIHTWLRGNLAMITCDASLYASQVDEFLWLAFAAVLCDVIEAAAIVQQL